MQALSISPTATDIGQLFAGGGEAAARVTRSQAGKGTASGEVGAGLFFAALTLGEGEGELGDGEAQGGGAAFDLSAEKGSEEQPDSGGEGVVAVAVSEEIAPVLSEAPLVAQDHEAVTPRWLWTGIETGPLELSLVAAEPDRGVAEVRRADDASRRGPGAMDPLRVAARVPAKETSGSGPASRQRPVPRTGTVGHRDFSHMATAVVRATVPQMILSQALVPEAPVSQTSLVQSSPEVVAPEVLVAEAVIRQPQVEQVAKIAHDSRSRAGSGAELKGGEVREGKSKVLGDLPAGADRQVLDVRQSEATAKVPLVQASPVRRDRSTQRDIDIARVVRGEALPERHTGAGRGEPPEASLATTSLLGESRPEQRQRVGTVPVEKGSSEREEPRLSRSEASVGVQAAPRESAERRRAGVTETRLVGRLPHPNTATPTKGDAIEKLVRELPVENSTRKPLKRTDPLAEYPQAGKAVENSSGEPSAKVAGSPGQRSESDDKARFEVPPRVGERSMLREAASPRWRSRTIVLDAVEHAFHRAAEVPGQRSAVHSDDREVRPVEPELQQSGQVLSRGNNAAASARTETVEVETYRLTLETGGKKIPGATQSLKAFRNNGLEEVVPAHTGNPQPVDKELRGHGLARLESAVGGHETTEGPIDRGQVNRRVEGSTPAPVTERARFPRADQARLLFGAEQDGFTEMDADREGPATKRPAVPPTERSEQQAPGLDRTELHSEKPDDPAQPRQQLAPAPFVKPSKAGPQTRGARATSDEAKADLQIVNAPAPKSVGDARPPLVATPSSSMLLDKVPDAPAERPVAGPDAPRRALVETALLDRRADQNALQVQVKDDQLGRVVVRLTERAGLIRAMVRTDGTQSRDLLNQQLPALMESLMRRGFETRQDGLAEEPRGSRENTDSRDEQRRQRHPQRQRREARGAKPEFRIRLN